jgi:high-affinity iron transporter
MSGAFDWSAWYGEIIQGVFNIDPTPTVLQLVAWLAYLAVVLALFFRPTFFRPAGAIPAAKPAAPQASVTAESTADPAPSPSSERSTK